MNTPQTPVLRVAAKAIIVNDEGNVLILRESSTDQERNKVGQWGLGGGRLEPGEVFAEGLKREVFEETGLEITIDKPLYVGEWHPVIKGTPHQIIGIFMICKTASSEVQLSPEHDKYEWIDPKKRADYNVMEPDRYVIDELAKLGQPAVQ